VEKRLKQILEHMTTTIEGIVASAVVLQTDGLELATLTTDTGTDCEAVSAFVAGLVNSNQKSAELLGTEHGAEDIIAATAQNFLVIRPIPAQGVFFYVMTEKNNRLGKTWSTMKKYEKYVIETLDRR
jgi:predicted regulator of Ras-like GTPase activity (Roadblock/LC7/MglB family)